MSDGTIGLWRYNRVTGYWKLERSCSEATAAAWLTIFQHDEPKEVFVVSVTRPQHNPTRKPVVTP